MVLPSSKFTRLVGGLLFIIRMVLSCSLPQGLQPSALQSILLELQDSFAYGMNDLVEYCGHLGPMHTKLKLNANVAKLFSPEHRYLPHEQMSLTRPGVSSVTAASLSRSSKPALCLPTNHFHDCTRSVRVPQLNLTTRLFQTVTLGL